MCLTQSGLSRLGVLLLVTNILVTILKARPHFSIPLLKILTVQHREIDFKISILVLILKSCFFHQFKLILIFLHHERYANALKYKISELKDFEQNFENFLHIHSEGFR